MRGTDPRLLGNRGRLSTSVTLRPGSAPPRYWPCGRIRSQPVQRDRIGLTLGPALMDRLAELGLSPTPLVGLALHHGPAGSTAGALFLPRPLRRCRGDLHRIWRRGAMIGEVTAAAGIPINHSLDFRAYRQAVHRNRHGKSRICPAGRDDRLTRGKSTMRSRSQR